MSGSCVCGRLVLCPSARVRILGSRTICANTKPSGELCTREGYCAPTLYALQVRSPGVEHTHGPPVLSVPCAEMRQPWRSRDVSLSDVLHSHIGGTALSCWSYGAAPGYCTVQYSYQCECTTVRVTEFERKTCVRNRPSSVILRYCTATKGFRMYSVSHDHRPNWLYYCKLSRSYKSCSEVQTCASSSRASRNSIVGTIMPYEGPLAGGSRCQCLGAICVIEVFS